MTKAAHKSRIVLLAIAGVAILGVAIVGVTAAVGGDAPKPPQGDELLADINSGIASDPNKSQDIGQLTRLRKGVFSSAAGDLADVDLLAGNGGIRCVSVAGDAYSSSVSCFEVSDAAKSGSYQVVIPLGEAPVLIVGYSPNGKSRVTVTAGGDRADGTVRGQVFMAALDSGALGPENAAPVSVAYGSQ